MGPLKGPKRAPGFRHQLWTPQEFETNWSHLRAAAKSW
jgi:hypothetical protein